MTTSSRQCSRFSTPQCERTVRGSSKPSQHSIKRSKTTPRAANHPRPGRIHLVQNCKICPRAAKEFQMRFPWAQPHPTPGRHMLFCLAGRFRVTASSGETRSFAAGDCLLMEDTSGKGHITEVVSHRPVQGGEYRLAVA